MQLNLCRLSLCKLVRKLDSILEIHIILGLFFNLDQEVSSSLGDKLQIPGLAKALLPLVAAAAVFLTLLSQPHRGY